jgi:hypothetical protein
MERHLCLLGCVGALGLAALSLGSVESTDPVSIAWAQEEREGEVPGEEEDEAHTAAVAGPRLQLPPGVLLSPSGPERGFVMELLPRPSLPTTGVGAFRPYPECAAVGMPFAGVKMCGEGHAAAAR